MNLCGIISFYEKAAPVTELDNNQFQILSTFQSVSGHNVQDIGTTDNVYLYIRAVSTSGKFEVQRFKVIEYKSYSKIKRYATYIVQGDGEWSPFAGDAPVATTIGILTQLSSSRGFASLPSEGDGNVDLKLREEIRNFDLQTYANSRDDEIDNFVEEVRTTFTELTSHNELKDQVQAQEESLKEVLLAMGVHAEKLTKFDEDIEDLKTQVQENTQNISGHETRITALETKTGEMSTSIQKVQTDLETFQTSYDGAMETVNGKITGLTTDLDGVKERITTAETDIKTLQDSATSSAEELQGVKDSLEHHLTDFDNYKTENDTIHEAITGSLNDLKTKSSLQEQAIDLLNTEQSSLHQDFIGMKTEYETSMDKINSFTDSIDSLNAKNDAIDADIQGVKTSIDDLKARDTSLQELIELQDASLQDTNKDVQEIKSAQEVQNTKIATLEEDVTSLLGTLDDKIGQNADDIVQLGTEIDGIKTKDSEQDTQIAQTIVNQTGIESKIDKEIADRTEAVKGIQTELSSLSETVTSHGVEIKALKDLQDSQKTDLEGKISTVDGKVKENSSSIKVLEGSVESINADLETKGTEIETLKTDVQDLKTTKADYTEHKEFVVKELQSLNGKIESNTKAINDLDKSITSVQEQIEGEIASFQEGTSFEIQALKDLTSSHSTDIQNIKNNLDELSINIADLEGSTKAQILNSEDQIADLQNNCFGLLCIDELPGEYSYSDIMTDIASIRTQNQELLKRVSVLETENQSLKIKLQGE